ncbi:hypothetical protein BDV10DRAFT_135229 [Aspergillus recurvatus]
MPGRASNMTGLPKVTDIQWAVFYSDCEYEIERITKGERITLAYNFYATDSMKIPVRPNNIVQSKSLPLYGSLKGLVAESSFMKLGNQPPIKRSLLLTTSDWLFGLLSQGEFSVYGARMPIPYLR